MRYTVRVPNTSAPLFTCDDAMTLGDILNLKAPALARIHAAPGEEVQVHGNGKYFLLRYTSLHIRFTPPA